MGRVGAGRKIRRGLLLCVLLAAAVFLLVEQNLSKTMLDLSYAQAYSIAMETMNQAALETLRDVRYDELFTVGYDGAGRVSMLSANTTRMNALSTRIALLAQERLSAMEEQRIEIPLGAAFGVKFLAGSGPRIGVRMIPVGSVGAEFETEFEAAGINQTRHRIGLVVRTTVRLILPTGSQRVDVTGMVPITENIIVGEVPDSFVDVANQDDMLNLIP